MLIYLYKDHYNPVVWGTGGIAYSFEIDYYLGTQSPPCEIALPWQHWVTSGHPAGLVVKPHPIRQLPSTLFCILEHKVCRVTCKPGCTCCKHGHLGCTEVDFYCILSSKEKSA